MTDPEEKSPRHISHCPSSPALYIEEEGTRFESLDSLLSSSSRLVDPSPEPVVQVDSSHQRPSINYDDLPEEIPSSDGNSQKTEPDLQVEAGRQVEKASVHPHETGNSEQDLPTKTQPRRIPSPLHRGKSAPNLCRKNERSGRRSTPARSERTERVEPEERNPVPHNQSDTPDNSVRDNKPEDLGYLVSSPDSEPPSVPAVAGLVSRRYVTIDALRDCLHSTMTRQRVVEGDGQVCGVCGRRPRLGWLYRCTEDATDCFSEWRALGHVDRLLAPWIVKAIAQGQYSEEQVRILVDQKIRVRAVVEAWRRPVPIAREEVVGVAVSSDNDGHRDDDYDDNDDESSSMHVEDVDTDAHRHQHQRRQQQSESDNPNNPQPTEQFFLILPSALPCNSKYCHECRPRCHDKAWASIDAVCTHDIGTRSFMQLCSATEQSNRRVSDANIVRNLGTRRPVRRPVPERFVQQAMPVAVESASSSHEFAEAGNEEEGTVGSS